MDKNFLSAQGCPRMKGEMGVYDWLSGLPKTKNPCQIVEVQFKHTRKEYFINSNNIPLIKGDIVAVETFSGHDIGEVSLTGELVQLQLQKIYPKGIPTTFKQIFRKATPIDLERNEKAKEREHETMIRARKISEYLNLDMKIGDVEFQGDGNKAIFYYIANGRIDFRELIKFLAEEFKVRIEMRQIGVRQEAGRMGGIGPCGRPLCCSSWLKTFSSVSTIAAHNQELIANTQKLTGQCAKLKCCLNFEIDTYTEALKNFPPRETVLETQENSYYVYKFEILKQQITYSTNKNGPANLVSIPTKRAFEVIELNKQGIKPEFLLESRPPKNRLRHFESKDLLGQESISRFSAKKGKKMKNVSQQNSAQSSENSSKETDSSRFE